MKTQINTHGGKREGAGPPIIPKGERKIQLSLYIEKDFVDEAGGRSKVQKDLKAHFYKSMNEVK